MTPPASRIWTRHQQAGCARAVPAHPALDVVPARARTTRCDKPGENVAMKLGSRGAGRGPTANRMAIHLLIRFRYTVGARAIGATVSAGALHAQGWGFESLIAHPLKNTAPTRGPFSCLRTNIRRNSHSAHVRGPSRSPGRADRRRPPTQANAPCLHARGPSRHGSPMAGIG